MCDRVRSLDSLLRNGSGRSHAAAKETNRSIEGIQIKGKEIKVTQYADDTTTFVKDGFSLGRLLGILNQIRECSGFKINSTKSEAICLERIGKAEPNSVIENGHRNQFSLWEPHFHMPDSVKCEVKNFYDKATKIQKMFNVWS